LRFAASGKRDGDYPSDIADYTKGHCDFSRFLKSEIASHGNSPGPAGRGSVHRQSLVDRNTLHFELEPWVFLTSA
jgi:hypothetical protein